MASKLSPKAQQLKQHLSTLFASQPDDLRLSDHLAGLKHDSLRGLTWFWGPLLYQRNPVVFREFILANFSMWPTDPFASWGIVRWQDHATELNAWLQQARAARDTTLVRRLLAWRYSENNGWNVDDLAIQRQLLHDYRAAASPAAQSIVLEEYDQRFSLDEATAQALYQTNRASGAYIVQHLPTRFTFWGNEKRVLWRPLFDAALTAGDTKLAYTLYRRQIDLATWRQDVERLANTVANTDELNEELRLRHLEGWSLDLTSGIVALLCIRKREILPYVREKLGAIIGPFYQQNSEALIQFARELGWWDLWSATIRASWNSKYFQEAVKELLADTSSPESERVERLRALAGVSQEWSWPGFGLARVHILTDDLAAKLYRQFPELVHGPFKPHCLLGWDHVRLYDAANQAHDEDLLDSIASRFATLFTLGTATGTERVVRELTSTLQTLREQDEAAFARRAANILTQIPAFVIYQFNLLLETNALSRLLFTRSLSSYLQVPAAVRDLVEGSEIHVQMLAYRIIAVDDDRARRIGEEMLDVLLGTLWRPLHRQTRLAAFKALGNVSQRSSTTAARILQRARAAFRLPDKKYPKEELALLVGEILQRWPELRSERERPVIYGLAEATP